MPRPSDAKWPAVILLQTTCETRETKTGRLTELLACTLAEAFGDSVLIIRFVDGQRHGGLDTSQRVHRLSLRAPEDDNGKMLALVRALNARAPHYAYTFIAAQDDEETAQFNELLVRFLDGAALDSSLFLRLVRLYKTAPDAAIEALCCRWEVLATVLLAPGSEATPNRNLARTTAAKIREEDNGGIVTVPLPDKSETKRGLELVRIRCEVAGRPPTEPALARWARAISHRRVGLALGGAGAWGFAHAALLTSLEELEIPVDLITSSSSGSLIGAYYSAMGRAGIDRLLNHAWRLNLVALTAFASMRPMELYLERETGSLTLHELELMFFPVTTNLTKMRGEWVESANLAWSVRASSTAPGLFGHTRTSSSVFVDGAVAGNVHAHLVDWLGADLVVAMNPLPAPKGIAADRRGLAGRLPLVDRIQQLCLSLSLMFHEVGGREARGYITYDPPKTDQPLLGTAYFYKGRQVHDAVIAQPEFRAVLDQVLAAWRSLRAPRTGARGQARASGPRTPAVQPSRLAETALG